MVDLRRRSRLALFASSCLVVFSGATLAADMPIPPRGHPSNPHQVTKKGYLVVVVDKNGCAQSTAFEIMQGPSGVLNKRLAGGYVQVVTRGGFAGSPPIPVPKEINDDPNADIFDIIHQAYRRHEGQMQPGQPGPGQPGPAQPGPAQPVPGQAPPEFGSDEPLTPQELDEIERESRHGGLPPPQSYPDPRNDPDFQPLPEKVPGQQSPTQPGPQQPGPVQPGPQQPGPVTGPQQPGPQQPGPVQTGPVQSGPVQGGGGGQQGGGAGQQQFAVSLNPAQTKIVQRYPKVQTQCLMLPVPRPQIPPTQKNQK